MSAQRFSCSSIVPGKVDGPALVSNEAICFYLVEPETGILLKRGHCLEGRSLDTIKVSFLPIVSPPKEKFMPLHYPVLRCL